MKLLEENISVNIGLRLGGDFLNIIQTYKQQRKKIDKLRFIKIKYFGVSQHSINKVKTYPTE